MPFLTHAGVSLRYDRAGRGPALLLVHGWTCNRTFWERQVHGLRDRLTVITVDLRGHGESSRPAKGYGVGALASDLEALVRALGVARIAVVGWSLGGMVALELARRLGEKASALGLVCTSAGGLADPENPLAQPNARAEVAPRLAADFRAFAREFAPLLFRQGAASPLLPWAAAQIHKTAPQVATACFASVFEFDARPWLPTLRVPTAVLHGRGDQLFPLAHGEYLAQHIPGATLTVFEESGHAPHLEEPDAFNAAVAKLLGV
jgi:pimeloyl-ACP methyl ester carboxylesterase